MSELSNLKKIEISSDDLFVIDELVRLSNGSFNRSSMLHCVINHYAESVKSALTIIDGVNSL